MSAHLKKNQDSKKCFSSQDFFIASDKFEEKNINGIKVVVCK